MRDVLLVLNAGSSSLKFQIFARDTLDDVRQAMSLVYR